MARLIDISYFIGERQIANSNTPAVGERLNWFIAKYETQFLKLLLGDSLYAEFVAGLLVDPVETQWADLRDGASYVYDDRTYLYSGLRDATAKRSPIADYVYYHYLRDAATQSTGIGEVKTKGENSTATNSMQKQVRAWNDMAVWVRESAIYLNGVFNEWSSENKAADLSATINTFNL